MPIEKEAFKQMMVKRVEARKWRNHRWYQKVLKKELTLEQARFWHLQQHVIADDIGHRIVAPIYLKVKSPKLRVKLLETMLEEETGHESGTAAHSELHVRAAMALGATREQLQNVMPLPETQAWRSFFDWIANHGTLLEASAAAFIAGEGQSPDLFDDVGRVLQEQFGLTRDQTAFYWVHGKADVQHSENAREMVAQLAQTDADQQAVLRHIDLSLDVQTLYLSGLYRVLVEDRPL